ncbi:MAG: MFS transporter, partial [Peptococcaceae bacterium]
LLLSLAGSLCLLMAFSNITVWGLLSAPVLLLTIAGGVSLLLFFRLEGRKEFPLLYVKVFRYEGFLSSVVLLCVGSILINASNNILPVFLQNVRGLTTTQAALVMLPAPLILMFVVPLMGKYYDRIGPQPLLYAITAIGLIACLVLAQIDAGSAILFIVAALILRDIGSGSVNMPATNMGMQAIPTQYATHAAAVTSWIRQCVISLTIGLSNTFQTARTNHYMTVYADTAEPLRYQLSYSHAMSELFYLLTICFVVGLIAVYFSKSRRNG